LVCKNWPLEKALTHVFSPHGIQYSFNNNTIVLSIAPVAKERAESSEQKKAVAINEREQYTPEKHKISGVVLEANGDPIIGASVFVKGTTIGTATNTDGEFTIEAPANSVLSISYIGFATREVAAKSGANLKITLKEDEAQALNEVVVVGYGTQKKATVTGAIASVSTKDLVQTPQANISNMLVGKMPGLIAMQRSGAPGEDNSTLLIRGVSTFSDNTAPLVMIDGVERPNYNGLDPNEIESVSILKDASATAIYGVRGANGVILITTRKGQKGKPHLSYSGNFAVQSPTALPHYLNSAEYCEMYNEALKKA
jgi:putative outer membrane protein, probably involved in nutrient binding